MNKIRTFLVVETEKETDRRIIKKVVQSSNYPSTLATELKPRQKIIELPKLELGESVSCTIYI